MEEVIKVDEDAPVAILFVDDEKNVLQSLRRLFMDEDYEILVANSGEEGLEIINNHPNIGVIVSDQRMPGLTRVDFLEKAKEILPDSMRILLTGYADINAVAEAINRGGAYRYITKPWNDEELLHIIKEAANKYSLIRENKRLHEIIEKQNEELKKWNSQLEYFVQEQTIEIQRKNDELKKMNEALRRNFKNSIQAFSALIELRDKRTANHSKHVAELSSKIAKSLDLSSDEIETVAVAALLHDIGKIGMSDMLLLKDIEDMDEAEFNEYKQHPVRGQTAVDSVENLRDAGVLIRHHHEWVNGNGFPDRLKGKDIPIGAMIISVADFIDRSLGQITKGDPVDIAMKLLSEYEGKRFDPEVIKHAPDPIKDVYEGYTVESDMVEIELPPHKLKPGMILARDVKSGTGLILLTKGVKLNEKIIQSIKRYYQLDPSKHGVYVWVKRNYLK